MDDLRSRNDDTSAVAGVQWEVGMADGLRRRDMLRIGGAVAGAALVGTAGCGDDEAGDANTLTVQDWLYTPDDPASPGPGLKAVDEAFVAANPDITVKHELQPFDNYFSLLQSQIAARRGPDIIAHFGRPSAFQYLRALAPITDAISTEHRASTELIAQVSADLSVRGTIYGIPAGVGGYVMYYHRSTLAAAGLPPEVPTTWDGFLSALARVKAAGKVPLATGTKDGAYVEWLWENIGAQVLTEEEARAVPQGRYPLDSPELVQAMRMVKELFDRGFVAPGYADVAIFPDLVDSFAAGNAAFFLGLLGHETQFRKVGGDDFGGNGLFPRVAHSRYDSQFLDTVPSYGYSVTKWSRNRELAGRYLDFFLSPQAQQLLFEKSTVLPVNAQAKVSSDFRPTQNIIDWLKIPHNHNGPDANLPTPVSAILSRHATAMMTGARRIEDVLAEAQAEMQRYVKKYPIPTR